MVEEEKVGPDAPPSVAVRLRPGRILRLLVALAVVLAAAGVVAHLAVAARPTGLVESVGRLFLLDTELTISAWWSSVQLLLLAALLAWVGASESDGLRARWWGLAVIAALAAVDEVVAVHEPLPAQLQDLLALPVGREVVFVGLAVLVVVVVAAIGWPLWRRADRSTRTHWAVAALVYGTGAVLVDVVEQLVRPGAEPSGLRSFALLGIEEGLEMLGVALLVYAVLRNLVDRPLRVTVEVSPGALPAGHPGAARAAGRARRS